MKVIKLTFRDTGGKLIRPVVAAINPLKKEKIKNDIILNVEKKGAMIRFGTLLFLPMLMLVIDKHLVIYTAPVVAYLFISAIVHFCVVKYLWHRYIKHESTPVAPAYGDDPNYPEESI
jgi:hypothetical protein